MIPRPIPFLTVVLVVAIAGPAAAQRPEVPDRGELIKRFDTDGDGRLSIREIGAARASRDGAPFRQLTPELFRRLDRNGDGRLDAEELAAARGDVRSPDSNRRPAPDQTRNQNPNPDRNSNPQAMLLKRFDTNGNGQLDPDERQRLSEMSRRLRGGRGAAGGLVPDQRAGRIDASDAVQRFDANGNGQLDPEERQRALSDLTSKKDSTEKDSTRKDSATGRNRKASDAGGRRGT